MTGRPSWAARFLAPFRQNDDAPRVGPIMESDQMHEQDGVIAAGAADVRAAAAVLFATNPNALAYAERFAAALESGQAPQFTAQATPAERGHLAAIFLTLSQG